MSRNIGIDLGTTHSLVATVISGSPRCLLDDDGHAILPSVVRYTADGVIVGHAAQADAELHPRTTLSSVKRFMGRSAAEAAEEAARVTYQVVDDGGPIARFQVSEEAAVTPIEVSAEILKVLKDRAADALMANPAGVVITVPAYFDDAQRQATRDAGRLAGLDVKRLVNEPTAAALAYGLQNNNRGVYAVYDLGGGTFDISILELTDGVFQVRSTAGDTHLGGDDFDNALIDHLVADAGLSAPRGGDLRLLRDAAEAAKKALTDAPEAVLELTLLDGSPLHRVITRPAFEALIQPIVERTATSCKQAMADAGVTPSEIDGVILVGGSTRVPLVRRFVGELFHTDPLCDLDPDQVVALGAAIQADILTGESELAEDMLLLDVVPLSLGIEIMGGVVERLIPRASMLPAEASETFTTHVDGQTAIDLHVLQGERELATDCRSLARFKLSGIPDMPAGLPRVKVTFLVDADGILHVTATEKYTGVSANIDVTPSYGLDDDLIEQMLEDSIDHADDDVAQRMVIEARVEAEQILHALNKALEADRGMLTEDEAAQIDAAVASLKEAMAGDSHKRIQNANEHLDEVSAPFAQRRIERDLRIALEGEDASEVGKRLSKKVDQARA